MARNQCHRCVKLNEHYSMVKAQFDLKEKLNQIMYNLSDAALGKMPDFQQRVSGLLSWFHSFSRLNLISFSLSTD
jgi:antiviral helicase SKI2